MPIVILPLDLIDKKVVYIDGIEKSNKNH